MTTDVHAFTCNLCDAMCGLRVTVEDGERITEIRGNPDDVLSHGHICPKGPALRELHEDPDRLRQPVRRTATGWEPIGWDEAFVEAAAGLRAVQRRHGRDGVALYIGNPTAHSHRASFGSQAIDLALGTKNRFNPNSQDSNPRLFSCMQVYGDGLSIPVPDVDRTDFLLMLGANPAATNGSMLSLGDVRTRLRGIRTRGGRVVLIDPRRTESAAWADVHHFIRPGGDSALLLAMLNVLFAEKLIDEAQVERQASGLAELRAIASRFPPSRVAESIGISAENIQLLARELAATKKASVYSRVGVCQSEFGPVATWLVEVMNIVTGHLDREGCAMFPTPAADIGPLARLLIGNKYGRWKSRVRGLPEFLGALPSAVMAEEMDTPGPGQIRGFVCFAGNPVLTTPNGARLTQSLPALEYMVAIDFYVNETTRHANIIFPPGHLFESGNYDLLMAGFTVRNIAKYSLPILKPRPGGRDDWEILSELAIHLTFPRVGWLRRALKRLTRRLPEQAIDLLLRLGRWGNHFVPGRKGLTLQQLRETPNGIDLGALVPEGRSRICTPDRRARLAPPAIMADIPRVERWIDAQSAPVVVDPSSLPFKLIGRRHLRSNNSWMHNVRSLVKGPDRSQLLMNPVDAARAGVQDGALVQIRSRTGHVQARLAITEDMMAGVVSLPHGFGHAAARDTLHVAGTLAGPSSNELTDHLLVEPVIGTSILNGVPVAVEPVVVTGDDEPVN